MKKAIRILTHPLIAVGVISGILWFCADLRVAVGFSSGLAVGLIWGIKATWAHVKKLYALYPLDQVPVTEDHGK